jgi:copper transport protein
LSSNQVRVDVSAVPGAPGANELHFTAFSPQGAPLAITPSGGLTEVNEFQVSAGLPSRGIAPIPIPVRRIGPGHYISSGVNLPIRGDWNLTVRVLLSETDQAALTGKLPVG